MRSVE
ncbi:unnamed protein product, partial [Rotaria sp. Silwood1]